MSKEIDLRKLVIKAFHISEVEYGDSNVVTTKGTLCVDKKWQTRWRQMIPEDERDCIEDINIRIIKPENHDVWTNTIMDIVPISTKVLGVLGEGITHTLTGVCILLTGVDTEGKQCHEFGSSEGILKNQIKFGKAGTPVEDDYIISFDVTLKAGTGQRRQGPTQAHAICDRFVQEFREQMKKFRGNECTERHEYHDVIRPGKKKVLIIKQVAGQGAMYDTHLFADEPSGVEGGKSIIDMGNMPVLVSPNEYRDGIIRSMQ